MTEEEMNRLADIIVDKLLEKQAEYDQDFLKSIESQVSYIEFTNENLYPKFKSKEEKLSELNEKFRKALEEERYEDAAKLLNKINKLKE